MRIDDCAPFTPRAPPFGRPHYPPPPFCENNALVRALLRVDLTQSSETGTVPGLRWHNLLRERRVMREVRIAKDGEGGHKEVRGRWAVPPTEGEGSREGQR